MRRFPLATGPTASGGSRVEDASVTSGNAAAGPGSGGTVSQAETWSLAGIGIVVAVALGGFLLL